MSMVKEKDFVEIDYTGTIKETNEIFDTTYAGVAAKNNLTSKKELKPVIICVGEGHLLPGLDQYLVGKNVSEEFTVELSSDKAFGKKNASLIKLIPSRTFREHKIAPMPGLEVSVDGMFGIIKNVSGGRIMVDFNHPLAGKDLVYTVKINKLISDEKQKIQGFLATTLNIPVEAYQVVIEAQKAVLTFKDEFPQELWDGIAAKLKELIPTITEFQCAVENEKKK